MSLLVCLLLGFASGYTLAFFASVDWSSLAFPSHCNRPSMTTKTVNEYLCQPPLCTASRGRGARWGDPPDRPLPGLPRRAAGRGKRSPSWLRRRREVSPVMGRGKGLPLRPVPRRPPLGLPPAGRGCGAGLPEPRRAERSAGMRPACRSCHHPARSPT